MEKLFIFSMSERKFFLRIEITSMYESGFNLTRMRHYLCNKIFGAGEKMLCINDFKHIDIT